MKFLTVAHHDSICQHFKQKYTGLILQYRRYKHNQKRVCLHALISKREGKKKKKVHNTDLAVYD